MTTLGLIAGITALVWAYASVWMVAVALFRRRRLGSRPLPTPPQGRWLLVRPCAGLEPELERTLTSVRDRTDRLELEVVFGLSEHSDPAFPVVTRACETLRAAGMDASIEVVPPTGPNRKAATLAGVIARRHREHAGVINIDSNVDVADLDLAHLVAPLGREQTGAAWMPAAEQPGTTLGDRASGAVLCGSFHAFGLLSALDPSSLVGKVFAVRADAVAALDDLADYLGEDVELSARLRNQGLAVEPSAHRAQALPAHGGLADAIARQARWVAVVRAQRPALLATYPLMFAPTPLMLVLAGLAAAHSTWLALAAAGGAVSARLIVSAGARFASGLPWHPARGLIDAVLGDLVLWSALLQSLVAREVEWRGHRLIVDRSGRLRAV